MEFTYRPRGVCSSQISFDLTDNRLSKVAFVGGCNGNLKAFGKLVEGMDADKVVEILQGNTCGFRSTSCADQLTKAIRAAQSEAACS